MNKQIGTFPQQILYNAQTHMGVGIIVNASAETVADANGRKIVKAGTPLTGNIELRSTAFTKAATTGGVGSEINNAVGVLLHDVDVTSGNANGTLLIFGFVNLNRLETTVTAMLDTFAKKALSGKVTFLKD